MGYSYDMRGRLSCDKCGDCGGVRKVPCKVNYCQAVALCPECRKNGAVEEFRASCKERECERMSAEFHARLAKEKELLDAGSFVRCAAIGTDDGFVEVTFRNKAREELVRYMTAETYRAIPLATPATPDDYLACGEYFTKRG